MTTLQECRARDAQDPLASLRELFALPPGMAYLDGNSLGALPRATPARVAQVVEQQWGQGLIASWNDAGWVDLPARLGDRLAPWIGAGPGQVVFGDSTSANLYKVLSAAAALARQQGGGTQLLSERGNFPTDLYIAQSVCAQHGLQLVLAEPQDIAAQLGPQVAVLLLTHVNYRTGAMHDLAALTARAHAHGALCVWDLCHSAGAVPVDLLGAGADYAVGCGYKYLNGGPGAPAFVWAHPRLVQRSRQPLSGWFGHAAPFAFTPEYEPAAGIERFLCGTPPVLALAALQCGLEVLDGAVPLGGMAALRAKSLALTDLFIELVEARCAGHGLGLATPRAHARRGSQVSLTHAAGPGGEGPGDAGGYAIVQALIARAVVGDFRRGDGGAQPDILRFGFAPLYTRFEDVWHAAQQLGEVLDSGEWRQPRFSRRGTVT